MQTFLPYADFEQCASVLDSQRLNKQLSESYIMLNVIARRETSEVIRIWEPAKIYLPKWLSMDVLKIGQYRETPVKKVSKAWLQHPATKMWKKHRWALVCYTFTMLREAERRSIQCYQHRLNISKFGNELTQDQLLTLEARQNELADMMPRIYERNESFPWWLGHEQLHSSHRAALLFKNPDYYSQFGWDEEPLINYYWPC